MPGQERIRKPSHAVINRHRDWEWFWDSLLFGCPFIGSGANNIPGYYRGGRVKMGDLESTNDFWVVRPGGYALDMNGLRGASQTGSGVIWAAQPETSVALTTLTLVIGIVPDGGITASGGERVIGRGDGGTGDDFSLQIPATAGSRAIVFDGDDLTPSSVTTTAEVSATDLTHVTAVWDGTDVRFYFGKELQQTTSMTGTILAGSVAVAIGRNSTSTDRRAYAGVMAYAYAFSRALPVGAILQLADDPYGPFRMAPRRIAFVASNSLDSREKRFSMMNFGDGTHVYVTFEADGTVDLDDRQHLLDCYSGIAFAAPAGAAVGGGMYYQYYVRNVAA